MATAEINAERINPAEEAIQTRFRRGLQNAYELSEIESLRQVSALAGMSAPQVASILRGDFDESRSGPGVFGVYRMAKTLGVTIDELFEGEPARVPDGYSEFNQISRTDVCVDTLVEAFERSGHRLEGLDRFSEHFDTYYPSKVDAIVPKLRSLGRQTLFAMRIKTTSVSVGQRELIAATPQERRKILDFHAKVQAEGMALDCSFTDHKAVSQPIHVRAVTSRLGLLCHDQNGNKVIVIRCAPIPV